MKVFIVCIITAICSLPLQFSHAQSAPPRVVVIPLGDEDGVKVPSRETESNNSPSGASQAFVLESAEFMRGEIAAPGDVDYYEIFSPYCTLFTFEVVADGGSTCGPPGDIDSDLTVFDMDTTTELAFNDDVDGSTNHCSQIQRILVVEGFYFIRVRASEAFSPNATFNYRLLISSEPGLC